MKIEFAVPESYKQHLVKQHFTYALKYLLRGSFIAILLAMFAFHQPLLAIIGIGVASVPLIIGLLAKMKSRQMWRYVFNNKGIFLTYQPGVKNETTRPFVADLLSYGFKLSNVWADVTWSTRDSVDIKYSQWHQLPALCLSPYRRSSSATELYDQNQLLVVYDQQEDLKVMNELVPFLQTKLAK